jgi:acyl-CoA synthetase (AMP-forming)/AMP-acid ligase II
LVEGHGESEQWERRSDDVAFLIGTSGTTGAPKLAMLTHASFAAAVEATLAARPVAADDVLLTPFPLCHVAGYNVFVYHARARPIVLMRQFDPLDLTKLVAQYGVTALSLAPTMIAMLLDADVDHDLLSQVRSIGYGASPVPATVLRRGVARWGCDFSQGYGMTELSGNAVFLGPAEHRAAAAGDERLLRAAGYPAPGVELCIAESDDEVLVRAPQVMAGYWSEPETSEATLRDGWLHTGDVGKLDDDGLLTLIDRTKDVIVTGGENVASREVEDVLHEHEAVRDVAVIGLPDSRWGERVTAVVVLWPDKPVSADALVELSRSRLARFKAPREVVFVDELPRNATGKVLKQVLRERLAHREP